MCIRDRAVNAPNGTGAWTSYGFNFQRYMVPWVKSASGEMDAARAFSQFDIDKDPPRLEELRRILDATDADLSAFRKHGGKLLMYFGWADPQLNAKMGVEYYEQVVDKMGPSVTFRWLRRQLRLRRPHSHLYLFPRFYRGQDRRTVPFHRQWSARMRTVIASRGI